MHYFDASVQHIQPLFYISSSFRPEGMDRQAMLHVPIVEHKTVQLEFVILEIFDIFHLDYFCTHDSKISGI